MGDEPADHAGSPGRIRRSLDETRELLLETGAAMVGTDAAVTVGRVELIDVCHRVGLTTVGSAYKIWETQEEFRIDLLRHVVSAFVPGRGAIDLVTESITREAADLPTVAELIRSATGLSVVDDDDASLFSLYIALLLAGKHDDEIATTLHDVDVGILDAYAKLYDAAASVFGLEWVPPYGPEVFATLVSALSEGMVVRSVGQPDIVNRTYLWQRDDCDDGAPWTLLGCGIMALIETCTRPRRGSPTATTDTGD